MPRLLPRSEPPAGYVAFVERHLASLRRAAADVVGTGYDADELYVDVLVDVAVRWPWLELLRDRLGRPGAAEAYLRRAFARRSGRWRSERSSVESPMEISVWRPEAAWPAPRMPRSNAAVRLAPFVRPVSPVEVGPVAEAVVAWCHAYEVRVRRRLVTGLVVVLALLILVANASGV